MLFRKESLNRKNEHSASDEVSCQKFKNVHKYIHLVNVQKLVHNEDRNKDGIFKSKKSDYNVPH